MESVGTERGREVDLQQWQTMEKQVIQRWCRNNLLATFAIQWYLKRFNTYWNISAVSRDSNKPLPHRFPDCARRRWLMKASVKPTRFFIYMSYDRLHCNSICGLLTSNYWSINEYDDDVSERIRRTNDGVQSFHNIFRRLILHEATAEFCSSFNVVWQALIALL